MSDIIGESTEMKKYKGALSSRFAEMMLIGILKREHELVKIGTVRGKVQRCRANIEQKSANFSCRGPDCKYFRFYRPHGLCQEYSTLSL